MLSLAAVACTPDTSSLPLRPGVVLVHHGPSVSDGDCLVRFSEPGVCPTWTDLVVHDAARDGDRLAVLFMMAQPGGGSIALAQSPDLGRTWTVKSYGSPPTGAQTPSLYLAQGKTFLFWVQWIDAPLGGRPLGLRWEMTDDGSSPGYLATLDTGMIAPLLPSTNGRARTFIGPIDLNDPASGFYDASWGVGEDKPTYSKRCVGVNACNPRLATGDGQAFMGTFDRGVVTATGFTLTEACFYGGGGTVDCVPWSTWPAATAKQNDPPNAVVDDGASGFVPARFYARDGHALVQRLMPGAVGKLAAQVDLGAGRPAEYTDSRAYSNYRARYGPFSAVVKDDGSVGLFRPRGVGGLDAVVFPNSPCTSLSACGENPLGGYGQATFALPLGGDEYLVLYVVDTYLGDLSNEQSLFASREKVTFQELHAAAVDPQVLYPGARPQTAYEELCLRASSCFPGAALSAGQCARFWSSTSTGDPGSRAAAQRFLGTPAGCEGFRESWPELPFASTTCRINGCTCDSSSTGLFVCREDVPCGLSCTKRGGTCAGQTCSGVQGALTECDSCTGDGRAVQCATVDGVQVAWALNCATAGLACESCSGGTCGPHCVDRASCPTDGMRCDGNVLVLCSAGLETRRDCSANAETCNATTGSCSPPSSPQACAFSGTKCMGTTLFECPGDGSPWVYADCAALGFGGCGVNANGFGVCQ